MGEVIRPFCRWARTRGEISAQYLYLDQAPIAKPEGRQVYAIHADQSRNLSRIARA